MKRNKKIELAREFLANKVKVRYQTTNDYLYEPAVVDI